MEIRPTYTSYTQMAHTPPTNSLHLKHELTHFSQLLEQALSNPDHINQAFCQDLSTSILHLHTLIQAIPNDASSELTDAKTIVGNILEAPLYVE